MCQDQCKVVWTACECREVQSWQYTGRVVTDRQTVVVSDWLLVTLARTTTASCFRYAAMQSTEPNSFNLRNHQHFCGPESHAERRKLADIAQKITACVARVIFKMMLIWEALKNGKLAVIWARERVVVHEVWCTATEKPQAKSSPGFFFL